MSAEKPKTLSAEPARPRARAGDGVITWLGGAVGVLLIVVLGAGAWWTLRTNQRALVEAARERTDLVARMIASNAQTLLQRGDLTELRLSLHETAAANGLSACRIQLADGTTIADADLAAASNKATLPGAWPAGGERVGESSLDRDGVHETSVALTVPGRGTARVSVESPLAPAPRTPGEAEIGLGVIGVAGMAGWLLAFRWLRARLRGFAAVRSALMASGAEGSTSDSLAVSELMGAEARSWNVLMAERDRLRATIALRHAASAGSAQSRGDTGNAVALEGLWLGVMLLDGAGNVEYANGAAAVMLRSRRETLIGRAVGELLPDEGAAKALEGAMKSRQRASVEFVTSQESQERTTLRLTVKALRRGDLASTMLLIEDVTQQRVADESRNAFVAQATHELRTPLTNIRLYVETLVDEGDSDAAVKARCLNVISGEVRRLERIVADMLSVSEIEAGSLRVTPDDVQPAQLFEELEADFRAQAEDKEITLGFELPPKFAPIRGDRDKLTLALHNIVGNALKYTPAGGVVKVAVEQTGEQLSVAVTDNGIGIKQEECELIFDRFYRAKDKRVSGITGSGLGLALARQIARLHGGDITVKSAIDKGSTFTLTVASGTSEVGKPMARAA